MLATLIREGDHKHKIMDRAFMPKYGTVSQVLLQLVVDAMVAINNYKKQSFYVVTFEC